MSFIFVHPKKNLICDFVVALETMWFQMRKRTKKNDKEFSTVCWWLFCYPFTLFAKASSCYIFFAIFNCLNEYFVGNRKSVFFGFSECVNVSNKQNIIFNFIIEWKKWLKQATRIHFNSVDFISICIPFFH